MMLLHCISARPSLRRFAEPRARPKRRAAGHGCGDWSDGTNTCGYTSSSIRTANTSSNNMANGCASLSG